MKLGQDVLDVLDTGCELDGTVLRIVQALDRKLYVRVDEALRAMGASWNRKLKGHVFGAEAAPIIKQAIEDGEVSRPQDQGFYPTPDHLVGRMLDLAGVVPGMHMLEPSAGRGAIAVRAVERGAEVECFEIQPELLSDCAAELANTADHAGRPAVLHLGDFLLAKPRPVFDAVVMNPPFARRDGGDAAHILHAYRFLKPSGRLVAVASAGVAFRESADDKALRRLAEDGGSIEPLPDRTFSSAGTDVRTVLVTLRA